MKVLLVDVNQRIAIFASIRAWINFYREKSPRRSRSMIILYLIYSYKLAFF